MTQREAQLRTQGEEIARRYPHYFVSMSAWMRRGLFDHVAAHACEVGGPQGRRVPLEAVDDYLAELAEGAAGKALR